MTRFCLLLACMLLLAWFGADRATARQAPDPREVYELIRTNLPGMTDAELQTAAVEGLLRQLQPRVWLGGSASATNPAASLLTRTTLYDGDAEYFRVGRVETGLASALQAASDAAARSNRIQGVVLDLRYAGGDDYAAACAAADLFVPDARPLLDWQTGSCRSTEKTNLLRLPMVVLVNRETAAAAEALAAVLRETGVALLVGSNTAGRALISEAFALKNGQELHIARAGVKLGNGTELTTAGLTPDITVTVNPTDERRYWDNPFAEKLRSGTNSLASDTNLPPVERINEAALVREHRRGNGAVEASPRVEPAAAPVVRDPALARALDLIKGLAIVRPTRRP